MWQDVGYVVGACHRSNSSTDSVYTVLLDCERIQIAKKTQFVLKKLRLFWCGIEE